MKTHHIRHLAFAALALVAAIPARAQTFTTVTLDSTNDTGQHTSYAVVNGNPAICYYDATAQDLRYVRATNAAGTVWGAPVTVVSTGDSGTFCSLAVVNGNPAISYHLSEGGGDDLMYVRATDVNGASWGVPIATYITGKTGEFTCLRVVNGRPAISFYDVSDKALEYVRADDADGTAWSTLPLELDSPGGGGAGQFNSMTIVNGNPAISYYNQNGKQLRYIRATNADGTAWGAPVTLDTGGGAAGTGQYTSLAVVNGNPAISYHDAQNGDLHYIRATDANGTTWPFNTPVTVDGSSADSGHFTSLAVIGGVPAISYYDLTNGDLHYVTGNDASGTVWGAPVDVDTTGDVGQYTSLGTLNGVAAISYYAVTGGNLKFAYVPVPEIAVEQPVGTNIADGGSKDFGSVVVGANTSLTFTISNTGSANLTGLGITIDGADPTMFTVTGSPVAPVIPGGSTTLTVQFAPTSTGAKSAAIHIANNDGNENPFDINLSGTGINPEIVIEQPAGNERPDGSGIAVYFGTVGVGGNTSLVFTVKNTAVGDLTGLGITIDGADPAMFSVTVPPVAPVSGPAGSTTFTVQYAPTAAGTHMANLHITSNDSNESPYDLLLVGSTTAPDIAVYDTAWGGPEITNGQPGAISFGTTPVGTPVNHTFAVYNVGGGVIQCGTITVPAGFSILSAPSQMPPGGGVALVIQLTAAAPGVYSGSVSIGSNDPDENPFTFPITGTVTGGSAPAPVSSALGDIVTAGSAPDASGTASIGAFDVLRRGGFLGENGMLVFPGNLLIGSGTPPVTLSPNTFMGLWKDAGSGAKLLARSGDAAPEASGALFDVLPQVPAINDSGEVTFLASLVVGSGAPVTTVDNDTGLWSELGGTGTGILMREGDTIPGFAPLQVGGFASGCFATAHTGASTGEAAFSITMKNGSTDTAVLRASITGPTVTAVQVVARENTTAPGTAEQFGNLASTYTDALRMDATGNLAFVALTKTVKESLWYQPVGGATAKVFLAGEAAPGTTGPATFKNIKSPAIGSGGVVTFRGLLNNDGDNAAGLKNDGIWRGTGSNAASYACILRRGDSNATRPGLGLPAGALVGNLWNSWLTNANHGAWKGWLDVDGNGTSAAPTDVFAIYSDLSGAMSYVLKVGDVAPGMGGVATFASFDLPVVGGAEQMAFIGNVTGGGTTSTNNSGVWRSAPGGGALSLVLRTGDTMTTTQGVKTIKKVDFPGSGTTDRRWEQPVMDSTGRLIVYVTFVEGGASSQVLVP